MSIVICSIILLDAVRAIFSYITTTSVIKSDIRYIIWINKIFPLLIIYLRRRIHAVQTFMSGNICKVSVKCSESPSTANEVTETIYFNVLALNQLTMKCFCVYKFFFIQKLSFQLRKKWHQLSVAQCSRIISNKRDYVYSEK